jgi:xanthine dehydrogenase accessory factor
MRASEAAAHICKTLGGGEDVVEILVVEGVVGGPARGARMVVWKERVAGTLGSVELDHQVEEIARLALASRESVRAMLSTTRGQISLFVEPHFPPDELVIVGAGHIARPLCTLGAMLGYQVTVLDDRPGFATRERFPEADRLVNADLGDLFREVSIGTRTHLVLATRGHKYDFDALRDLLGREVEPAYIGMIGSTRRVRAALEQLARDGVPAQRLAAVYGPVGLDIEAQTPAEIAIAIAAELIRLNRGGEATSLKDRARVVERWIQAGTPREIDPGSCRSGE